MAALQHTWLLLCMAVSIPYSRGFFGGSDGNDQLISGFGSWRSSFINQPVWLPLQPGATLGQSTHKGAGEGVFTLQVHSLHVHKSCRYCACF